MTEKIIVFVYVHNYRKSTNAELAEDIRHSHTPRQLDTVIRQDIRHSHTPRH